MGLDISAYKLGDKRDDIVCEEYCYDNIVYVFTLNHQPIQHLTQFEEGCYYDIEDYLNIPDFHMSYSNYNDFRNQICKMALGVDDIEVWDNIKEYLDKPFVELINFADNEGCYDYVVAEKLLKDFINYKEKAREVFNDSDGLDFYYKNYLNYIGILEEVVKNKGIVEYR
jgi:hypothetical protein